MAGMIWSAETRGQFSAIANLRWQLFRNSLRSRRGKAELFSSILIGTVFVVFGLGGSVGYGAGAYYFVSQNRAEWLAVLLWPVFLFWQFFPIMATTFTENMDSSGFLRFPLNYRAYFVVRVVYGLFDPATTVGSVWLVGITAGIGLARPALLPWTALVLLTFAAVNVLLTRVVFAWVERWLAQRRTREIFAVLLFLFFMAFQFIGPAIERYERKRVPGLAAAAEKITTVQKVLPPGNAAEAIANAEALRLPGTILWLAGLAGYGVALVWILDFRLRAHYLGENLSEADVRRASHVETRKLIGWKVPRVSGPIAAVFEKELRTLSRSGPMLLTLVMPVLALFLLRIGRWHSAGRGIHSTVLGAADYGFPVGSIYALLMLTNLVYNSFGADGNGVQFFLFSPIRFREIVLGKNLAYAGCLIAEVALIGLVVNFAYGPPAPAMIAATIAGLLFAAPMTFAAGNLLSIYSPKKVDYGTFGRQRASQVTVLASFGIQIVIFGIGALTVFLAYMFGNLWLATPIFLILGIVTSTVYLMALGRLDKMALDRRETLVAELGKA